MTEGHDCDMHCICPLCKQPLLYNPYQQIHACPTAGCKNRPGLVLMPTLTLVEW